MYTSVQTYTHERDDADKRLSYIFLLLHSQYVHHMRVCICWYVACVNIHILHTTSSQRQYGFNRGGISSAITVEHLYRAEPLTVGQYISHQSLSRPSKKPRLCYSLTLSVIPARHMES